MGRYASEDFPQKPYAISHSKRWFTNYHSPRFSYITKKQAEQHIKERNAAAEREVSRAGMLLIESAVVGGIKKKRIQRAMATIIKHKKAYIKPNIKFPHREGYEWEAQDSEELSPELRPILAYLPVDDECLKQIPKYFHNPLHYRGNFYFVQRRLAEGRGMAPDKHSITFLPDDNVSVLKYPTPKGNLYFIVEREKQAINAGAIGQELRQTGIMGREYTEILQTNLGEAVGNLGREFDTDIFVDGRAIDIVTSLALSPLNTTEMKLYQDGMITNSMREKRNSGELNPVERRFLIEEPEEAEADAEYETIQLKNMLLNEAPELTVVDESSLQEPLDDEPRLEDLIAYIEASRQSESGKGIQSKK